MKWFLFMLIPGVLSLLLGLAASQTGNNVLLETYKLFLSFTLVGVIGVGINFRLAVAKESRTRAEQAEKDQSRRYEEAEKEQNRRYEESELTRGTIIKEFTDIFSQFYSVRKLYHSARSDQNPLYANPSPEYSELLRNCLQKTTDLEGRYGALKIFIIRHFRLPAGDLGNKNIRELSKKKLTAATEGESLRYALDILGEAYDDWRHAFEQGRKIEVTESWNAYVEVLGFLDQQTGRRADSTAHQTIKAEQSN